MQKSKKKLLGLLGLGLVAAMTMFAYLLPAKGAYAEEGASDSHTDVIRVTVYDRYPSVKIKEPATDYVTTSPEFDVTFDYENSTYVDFVLSYKDEEGNIVEIPLPRFNPTKLDPVFNYDSGTNKFTLNLFDYELGYGHYVLSAVSASPIGPSTGDAIEFDYAPVQLIQTGSAAETNDPIATVEYDDGVAKIELMPIDSKGKPLFDEPIIIEIEPDENGEYKAGSQSITFPFTENGFASGDYDILVTAYGVAPFGDEDSEEIEYVVISSPHTIYVLNYEQPLAPDVPNTGKFTGTLNIARSDFIITAVIAFIGVAMVAFILLGRKKKDYRKNLRSRK